MKKKIDTITNAVEGGEPIRSLTKRLRKLESEEDLLSAELEAIQLKKNKTEEQLLSAEVMADNYRTVPGVIDGLVARKSGEKLKAVLGQYVEVIEWREDDQDRKSGSVRIMLFEHAYLAEEAAAALAENKKKSAPLVNNGALFRIDWLRLRDLNPRPSG